MRREQTPPRALIMAAVLAAVWLPPVAWADEPTNRDSFRPPAVPLVASDPYLSIWSMADRLTDDTTRHWTRHPAPARQPDPHRRQDLPADGREPSGLPAMKQVGVSVLPTRTHLRLRRRPRARHAHVHDAGAARRPGRPGAAADLPDVGRPVGRRRRPCDLDLRQHQRARWRSTRPSRRSSGRASRSAT